MQICDKQYQSLNISASPSFATAQGRENERRDWTEETYLAKNNQPGNRYDWSRMWIRWLQRLPVCSSGTLTGLPLFLNLVAEVVGITNCPRRKTMRTNCFSPSDVIRWPRLCMHQSIGSGDNRTNVAIEFRGRCLWMLGER